MRLIDADALIPMMKYATTDSEIGVFPIKIGFNEIEKVINEQPTIEAERKTGRWIPCSERLPYAEYGESDNVLATCGYRDVEDTSVRWIRELYFNGGNWCYPTGETYEQKVYAWMPLPEPYREGEG